MPPAFGVSHDRKPEAYVIQLSKCHNYILQYNVGTRESLIDRLNRYYRNSKNMSKFAFAGVWLVSAN